ncbi:MAG TPA: hypothetical protein VMU22_06335 [Rhizomicrobium sp.]|nr:hypothetical protein [Rhizomicrobium sp.]
MRPRTFATSKRHSWLLLLVAIAVATTSARAQGSADPLANAARGFYDVYMTLHPSDGIPDAATRAKFAPYITPALERLFAEGHDAEQRYAMATKNQAPPLIEGDPFTPNFEGATSYRLGVCATDTQGGHCAVTLTYDDRKDKPISWTDTVYLVQTDQGWRVDDIAYGGTWEFGNKGRLTRTLKSAIDEGNSFAR